MLSQEGQTSPLSCIVNFTDIIYHDIIKSNINSDILNVLVKVANMTNCILKISSKMSIIKSQNSDILREISTLKAKNCNTKDYCHFDKITKV